MSKHSKKNTSSRCKHTHQIDVHVMEVCFVRPIVGHRT